MDELVEMSAIRMQKNGRIRMIPHSSRRASLSTRGLASLASNVSALLNTLCHNLQDPQNSLFAASVRGIVVDSRVRDVLLARIKLLGTDFLNRIEDNLRHPPRVPKARSGRKAEKLGVTVFVSRELGTARRGGRYGK